MQAVIAPRGDARTFLTHFVGSGLDDDRHVVEKFRSLANGVIAFPGSGITDNLVDKAKALGIPVLRAA